jgi:hypothetical protein
MSPRRFAAFFLAAALTACAAGQSGPESAASRLEGRSLRVTAASGQVSTLRLSEGGAVTASFGGREVEGRWAMDGDQLCFTWSGSFRECWPYAVPLRPGESRSITSSRGTKVQVQLQ